MSIILNFSRLIIIVLVSTLLAGCAAPTPTPMTTPSDIPPTNTHEPPQPSPTDTDLTSVETEFEVYFDGTECTASGPAEVESGTHSFRFTDKSGQDAVLYMVHLDEGRTMQEILDIQGEPGRWWPKEPWIHYDTIRNKESQLMTDFRVDVEDWWLSKPATHVIMCWIEKPENKIWFAYSINVIEKTSE